MQIKNNSRFQHHQNISPIDFVRSLEEEMIAEGFTPPPHIDLTPNKYKRFTSYGCKQNCCQYRIFDMLEGAQFRCFRRDVFITWFYHKYEARDPLRKKNHSSNFTNKAPKNYPPPVNREKVEEEITKILCECDKVPSEIAEHPYVLAKGIKPYGAVAKDSFIYIPITTINWDLLSIQRIDSDSVKRFHPGGTVSGGCHIIGEDVGDEVILICEGWATGCSIYYATAIKTVCAWFAGNILNVTTEIKNAYPRSRIFICADDDQFGDSNTGLIHAYSAARICNVGLIIPDFSEYSLETKPTDFNDLQKLAGAEVVMDQILAQINKEDNL